MQIAVVVERMKGNGYRARSAEPFAVTARGPTRDEAIKKLRDRIQKRLKKGTELIGLEVDPQQHPWMRFAGMFKEDPLFDDWQKAIADYRRQVDKDPDYL